MCIYTDVENLKTVFIQHENDIIELKADLDDAYDEIEELRTANESLEGRVKELEDMENYIVGDLDFLYEDYNDRNE